MSSHKENQNKEWEQWQGDYSSVGKLRFTWTLDKMKTRDILTVLDAGCGLGWHTQKLTEKYTTKGIDISSVAIQKAKQVYPECKFQVQSIEKIKVNYDAILCLAVLNMVEDDAMAIRAISQHCTWGYLAFQTYQNHLLHLRNYDETSVRKLLEPYGDIQNLEKIEDFIMVEIQFTI